MSDITTLMMAAAGGVAEETDANFNQTVLLLHGDGTNGAQNNTFLDSSTNNFTITRNGNTTQGTFSPFSAPDGRWSNYFDGSGDTLTAADSADFDLGSGDWTIELWANFGSVSGEKGLITHFTSAGSGQNNGYTLRLSTGNSPSGLRLVCSTTGTDVALQAAWTPVVGTWYHIAAVRDGGDLRIYVDGVQIGTTSIAITIGNPATTFGIGTAQTVASSDMNGYISNVRLVKGTCLYTGGTTFTPPSSPLTAVSGTELLTCQSNRFVDNSTNAFAITRNGDVKVTPFSPFAPTAAYSASVNGGSGYFDGTGDYLTAGSASDWTFLHNGSDWTCEFWVYHTTTDADAIISTTAFTAEVGMSIIINTTYGSGVVNGVQLYITRGVSGSEAVFNSTGLLKPNQWNYVAITFTSSTKTCAFTINGASAGSTANTGFAYSASAPTNTLAIGRYQGSTPGGNLSGYIGSLRISSNIRTGLTSIPTAPYTSDADTKLLTNFTNAGIFDNTGKNNLETVGNAQIDTTTKKYGTGSMEFDGTGDYFAGPATQDLDMGTGNWTLEGWAYIRTRNSNYPCIFSNNNGAFSAGAITFTASNADNANYNDRFVIAVYDMGAIPSDRILAANTTNSFNTWYHFAVVRNGTTLTLYRDGVSVGSKTISSSLAFNWAKLGFRMGGGNWDGVNGTLDGLIDDLRITKGVARDGTVVPTKAFPDL